MPDDRNSWSDPAPNTGGLGGPDMMLEDREAHEEQLREEVEVEHLVAEGQPAKPGLMARIKARFGRS